MNFHHFVAIAAVITMAVRVSPAADSRAFNTFDGAVRVAKIVAQIAPNEREFFVREFRGFASNNVGISKLISEELTKGGYKCVTGAAAEIEGRLFRLPRAEDEPLTGYSIHGTVYLSDGKERRFSVDIVNRDDGHTVTSETGEIVLPPVPDQRKDAINEPTIVGTEIRPSGNSPYAIEILTETGPGHYLSLRPRHDGRVIKVDLTHGQIYTVRLHNRSDYEAASEVLIDGLTRFTFADKPSKRNGRDLVKARQSRDIKGYFRDGHVVDSFLVGEYSKSVAAQVLPKASDVGTITVTFAAAWKQGDPVPPNEPTFTRSLTPSGTTKGPKRADPTATVQREIGTIRAIVKVRY